MQENLGDGVELMRHIVDEGVNIFDKLLMSGYVMDDVGRIVRILTSVVVPRSREVAACASIAWILRDNSEFRAKAYLVGYRRQSLQFVTDHIDDRTRKEYADINQMFEEFYQKRGREPAWYALGGGPTYMRQPIREAELPEEVQHF